MENVNLNQPSAAPSNAVSTPTTKSTHLSGIYGQDDGYHSGPWFIDMNYLMPFSIMLMILCVLLLILCYLRHRMRQRRLLQGELRLAHILRRPANSMHFDDYGRPLSAPERVIMVLPPSYDEVAGTPSSNIPPYTKQADSLQCMPPPYHENTSDENATAASIDTNSTYSQGPPPAYTNETDRQTTGNSDNSNVGTNTDVLNPHRG